MKDNNEKKTFSENQFLEDGSEIEERPKSHENESNKLRITIQDLEDYIDRRKKDWEKLNIDLDDYRYTLIGMEKAAKSHKAELQERDDDKITLAKSIIELEQKIAELDGRCAERKSMNEQLQVKIDQRAQEAERLTSELDQSKATEAQSNAKIATQETQIDSLLTDLSRQHEIAKDLESQITKANIVTTNIEAEMARFVANEEHSLENCSAKEQKISEKLRIEISTHEQNFKDLERQYDEQQAESSQAEAETAVFAKELGAMRDDLISKNLLIAQLETELSVRKETILLLDQNVQRLSDSSENVQSLDKQITLEGEWIQKDTHLKYPITNGVRMIIAKNGNQKIKFPLTKDSMTIGRSIENDIQLQWKCVSRNHARILSSKKGTTIEDLGSKNGIFVNDIPVSSFELHNGDHLEIGDILFEYIDHEEQAEYIGLEKRAARDFHN
jgi:chromosome segregation ATPase